MILIYKLVLGPILLLQGRAARRTALRLPEAEGERAGTVAAGDAHARTIRVLFVGDSSAAGVGVAHQDQALAAQAAAFLAARSRTTVEWQLVARSGVNTMETLQLLAEQQLGPADVIVTALGVNDVTAQRTPRQFLRDYQALLERLRQLVDARAVVINGVPPMHVMPSLPQPLRWYLGQCARRLDTSLKQWVHSAEHMAYVSLQWAARPDELALDGYHPGPTQYRRWAELIAASADQLLHAGRREVQPLATQIES